MVSGASYWRPGRGAYPPSESSGDARVIAGSNKCKMLLCYSIYIAVLWLLKVHI